jgi:hypothetical protein
MLVTIHARRGAMRCREPGDDLLNSTA